MPTVTDCDIYDIMTFMYIEQYVLYRARLFGRFIAREKVGRLTSYRSVAYATAITNSYSKLSLQFNLVVWYMYTLVGCC